MVATRTAILNLRVEPALKDALRIAADREHRSVSNMIEWLVRKHCRKLGISIPEQVALDLQDSNGRKNTQNHG
jgi:hypothetical protein